jgi:hypothetical protein
MGFLSHRPSCGFAPSPFLALSRRRTQKPRLHGRCVRALRQFISLRPRSAHAPFFVLSRIRAGVEQCRGRPNRRPRRPRRPGSRYMRLEPRGLPAATCSPRDRPSTAPSRLWSSRLLLGLECAFSSEQGTRHPVHLDLHGAARRRDARPPRPILLAWLRGSRKLVAQSYFVVAMAVRHLQRWVLPRGALAEVAFPMSGLVFLYCWERTSDPARGPCWRAPWCSRHFKLASSPIRESHEGADPVSESRARR